MQILIKRKNKFFPVQVDLEDYYLLVAHTWHITSNGYVATKISTETGRQTLLLHRVITKCPDNLVVDHIDRNPLNNIRPNLRVCTVRDNVLNQSKQSNASSKYKGVCWDANSGMWLARIKPLQSYKQIHIGSFQHEIDAAKAYNTTATTYGMFTELNDL